MYVHIWNTVLFIISWQQVQIFAMAEASELQQR
jgi:hypothetical protein